MNLLHTSMPKSAVAALVLSLLNACTTSSATTENDHQAQRLIPTGHSVTFDRRTYENFDDYVLQTKDYLSSYKVYKDSNNAEVELELATPFRTQPNQLNHCNNPGQKKRGIVLLHGLSDMPAAMRDIANAFTTRCFVSYSMLLPGHGARPADLLNISRDDWLKAAQFGIDSMQQEVDEVYVGGFSLGGLIALQTAINSPDIAGVFAFSPALSLHRSFYLDQTIWLRHIVNWLDTDPPDDSWRFESIPYNALAETQLLAKSVRHQLKNAPLQTPVFLAQSPDDAVVDAKRNQTLFERTMTHADSRLLTYNGHTTNTRPESRILQYPSILPEQRILGYAHQAIHISPDNKHYGVNGDYRNCHINVGNSDDAAVNLCFTTHTPYRGEVFGKAVDRYDSKVIDTLARLTFNPQFSHLFIEIDNFLAHAR